MLRKRWNIFSMDPAKLNVQGVAGLKHFSGVEILLANFAWSMLPASETHFDVGARWTCHNSSGRAFTSNSVCWGLLHGTPWRVRGTMVSRFANLGASNKNGSLKQRTLSTNTGSLRTNFFMLSWDVSYLVTRSYNRKVHTGNNEMASNDIFPTSPPIS